MELFASGLRIHFPAKNKFPSSFLAQELFSQCLSGLIDEKSPPGAKILSRKEIAEKSGITRRFLSLHSPTLSLSFYSLCISHPQSSSESYSSFRVRTHLPSDVLRECKLSFYKLNDDSIMGCLQLKSSPFPSFSCNGKKRFSEGAFLSYSFTEAASNKRRKILLLNVSEIYNPEFWF